MHVIKRDGRREPVMFDKITARIRRLCWGLDERYIDPVLIAQKVGSEGCVDTAETNGTRKYTPYDIIAAG